MKEKFTFLDHKADIVFEAFGETLEEAFENSALAVFSVIADVNQVGGGKKMDFSEKAPDLEELIVNLLQRLVVESDAESIFWKKLTVKKLWKTKSGYSITAQALGGQADHSIGIEHVKAVTHHEAKVEKKNGLWTARILLDI
ncbi:archease [Candidatus Micrarchaeota archaeon]|nr:archease [Candidatus Micrarchaeota archaeon]